MKYEVHTTGEKEKLFEDWCLEEATKEVMAWHEEIKNEARARGATEEEAEKYLQECRQSWRGQND